ncbi:hypothetical protein [Colwellia psychrerythraea]|uniref:Uncharacterized protein n=1 Tax=Colwellia psychrerythraea TaxID=28229 RepID=A0A099KBW1_COLPS|nr:hypothetical protein [Colwellia psychrerythraea]KGJ87815.1 hypothetical protein GAB14E_4493 [Colwellia psychrerythraea]
MGVAVVIFNLILSIFIFELWLRVENRQKNKQSMALAGFVTFFLWCCSAVIFYFSMLYIKPFITPTPVQFYVLPWAISMLLYILKFHAPRRKYHSFFNGDNKDNGGL